MIRNGKVGDVVEVLRDHELDIAEANHAIPSRAWIMQGDPIIGIINLVTKHKNWTEYEVILQPPSSGTYSGSAREFKRSKLHVAEFSVEKMGKYWGLFMDDTRIASFEHEDLAIWMLNRKDEWKELTNETT